MRTAQIPPQRVPFHWLSLKGNKSKCFVMWCMSMYVREVRRSLAGNGGRFHGWVNPTRSSGIRTDPLFP